MVISKISNIILYELSDGKLNRDATTVTDTVIQSSTTTPNVIKLLNHRGIAISWSQYSAAVGRLADALKDQDDSPQLSIRIDHFFYTLFTADNLDQSKESHPGQQVDEVSGSTLRRFTFS